MIHELKTIFSDYEAATQTRLKSVMASVVDLEGSSYRRPGVRMLILEDGKMVGAVSGGCVEKAIRKEAQEVFKSGKPKMMTYDGRYRLGCEGVLHILIEPLNISSEAIAAFRDAVKNRNIMHLESDYNSGKTDNTSMGTTLVINGKRYLLSADREKDESASVFTQSLQPSNRMYILGAEHDSVALSQLAASMGWEVVVVASPDEEKDIADFPGALKLLNIQAEEIGNQHIDSNCAVMVMSHNFARDVAYVIALQASSPRYIGILGPSKRREQLIAEIWERNPDIEEAYLDKLYGPAGLDIGAETAHEIAVSIMSEILSVFRKTDVQSLRDKEGSIHSR